MGPMRKDVLDKAAWSWVDTTDPSSVTEEHVRKAYRVDLPECRPGTCRRNCRGSPRCLSGLGEQRWITEPSDENSSFVEDPNIERRDSGSFLGLKNLGATCYVNSLLQLWFHNLPFRRAIYEWDPMKDPDERQNLLIDESKFPVTHVGHLQVLFANLQFSVRRYIDPSDFIHSLGLDTNQQQDAQEFSKLFISMLEDRLTTQTKPSVHGMISKNFKGEYLYVTKCSKCQKESERPSTFYELDLNIQGHRTLGDSLAEFLHEEKLEGANRYHCAVCGDKQDATRCIRLKSLPPVLHLQLLRFVYDRSKGHKKKLNSVIQFPETLDMSEYISLPLGSLVYNVSAVLVHMGSSAHSGHYVAHIKDSVTGTWHKYNDESVERMEGKKLTLGSEEDGSESTSQSKVKGRSQRCAKGFITSKNAYMLVYSLAPQKSNQRSPLSTASGIHSSVQTSMPTMEKTNGPERVGVSSDGLETEMIKWGLERRLVERVNEQNRKFEEWTSEQVNIRETYKAQTQCLRNEMLDLCEKLCINPRIGTYDFISTDWLSKCLHDGIGDESKVGPIDNSQEICPHGRVDPSLVTSMKAISVDAANILYNRFLGGPRVQFPQALCIDCVSKKCKELRLKNKITSDGKEISNLLKYRMDETDPGYWVGKNTLKSWKSIVLRSLEKPCDVGGGKEDLLKKERIDKNNYESQHFPTNNHLSSSRPDARHVSQEDEMKDDSHRATTKAYNSRKRSKVPPNGNSVSSPPEKRLHLLCSRNGSSQHDDVSSSHQNGLESCSQKERLSPSMKGTSIDSCSTGRVSSSTHRTHSEGESYDDVSDSKEDFKESDRTSPSGDWKEDKKEEEQLEENSQTLRFNDDAVCEHGNLNIDESSRRLVPPQIWAIFHSYFPSAPEFPRNSHVCSICQERESEGQAVKDTHRKVAQQQRECLGDLYLGRNRPNLDPCARRYKAINGTLRPVEGKESFFLVAQEFVDQWKTFIGRRSEPPLGLLNGPLLCQHGGLLFDPTNPEDCSKMLVLVWPFEWDILQSLYSADLPLQGERDSVSGEVSFRPAVCEVCQRTRREALQAALCTYDRAKIFVRRVPDESMKAEGAASGQPAVLDTADPEFQVACSALLSPSSSDAIRRSGRSRKPRGDKELTVCSDQTLFDLKKEIYKHFQVAPFDQHLTLDGRPLEGPANTTLGALNVYPRSILLLKADEPSEDASIMDDYIKSSAPEEGFKGTGLLSR